MNRTLENRMKKLEAKDIGSPPAIIVYAKWDELNEDAIAASFIGAPPTDVPIFVFSEPVTSEQWLAGVRKWQEDPTWHKTHGGTPIIAFPGDALSQGQIG
jgi:hypothetical protein